MSRLKVALDRDNFAKDGAITTDKALDRVAFTLENQIGGPHHTTVRLSFPANARYELRQGGAPVPLAQTGDWDYPWAATLDITGPSTAVEIVRQPAAGGR